MKPTEFDLDIRAIKNREVREHQIKFLKSNATSRASLSLGKKEPGKKVIQRID